ncbi:MAG: carboxypeptidase regulatory-like domain-containing protein [Acidobacteria bacterium]|nr:carboxypeptidase regulatory-like domain-containing protein [Acidobacteriota bacterium]MBI3422101.1 carboxypeptidase regulatory-like domain-containing protein [Acidobacteriota bacterium]
MLAKPVCAGKTLTRVTTILRHIFFNPYLQTLTRLCLGCALLCGGATVGLGQSFQGSLRGAVHDNSGSALPGATLTLLNEATQIARTTVANEAGGYVFERVDPGKYKITVTRAGFKKVDRTGILVETQQQITLDLALEIGDVAETVVVTDEVPLIESANASVGQVISKQFLSDLPNSGRNPFSLAAISPNYIPAGNPTFNRQQDQSGSSQISLAGGPVRGNNYLLDGVPIADIGNRAVIIPTFEAIQELKMQVNNYDAEAGRTGGGVFNVAARSGSNQLHGSLFGFLRPNPLQANNFFNNRNGIKRPAADYGLYGGSIGGPVYIPKIYNGKDKTFFWIAMEGYRMQSFLSETFTVPTDLERQGNFSQTKNGGLPVVVYDPLTTRTVNGQLVRDAFAGNIIPTNRQDPVGRALLQFFPKANRPGDASGRNNYAATSTLNDRADQQTFKLDHNFASWYKASAAYLRYGSREPVADYYQNIANPGGSLLFRNVDALAVNNIFTLNDTTILSVRYGYNTFDDNVNTVSAGFDPAQLGFVSSYVNQIAFKKFPAIGTGGAYGSPSQGSLGSAAPNQRRWYSHNFLTGVSKLLGRHSLKAGFDYRKLSLEFYNIGQASGSFTFTRGFTQGPNPNAATTAGGNELASMLLGTASAGSTQLVTPLSVYVNYFGGYVQDDFRLSQKLTLNFGMRYEYEKGLQERADHITVGFDPSAAFPVQPAGLGVKGGLLFAGVNGAPTQQVRPQKNKFGPRIGFAYTLNNKTTFRGGYGILWAPAIFSLGPTVDGYGALGFSAITNMVTSNDGGLTPANYLSNPFPSGLLKPTGSSLGLLTQVGQNVSFVDQNRQAAYVQQYSLDIQRELPGNIALTVGYVGSRGTNLQIGGINNGALNINQLAPQFMSRADLQTRVTNPFFGTPAGVGILSSATVAQAQLLRPFPQFGDVLMLGASGGNSFYNAATIKAQKRFSKGFSFLTAYTFSKLLDNITGNGNFFAPDNTSSVIDTYNRARDYGLSSVDTPHRFTVSGTYELPFGKNKSLLAGANGVVDRLVGGWQLNSIVTYQSGFPLSLTQQVNNTNAFSLGQRPNIVLGVDPATSGSVSQRIDGYLNAAAFSAASANTFGNAPRTIGVRSPMTRNWDLSVLKNTRIVEGFNAQFRLEAVNAFNTPVFRAPNTQVGNPNFGRITSQANFARVVQISLRLMW